MMEEIGFIAIPVHIDSEIATDFFDSCEKFLYSPSYSFQLGEHEIVIDPSKQEDPWVRNALETLSSLMCVRHRKLKRNDDFESTLDNTLFKCNESKTFHLRLKAKAKLADGMQLPQVICEALSYLRCDWQNFVDNFNLATPGPKKFSVASVYAEVEHNPYDEGSITEKAKAQVGSKLGLLGLDLLFHIASFLRAKAIYSWRITCFQMHSMLSRYIPGLKLQLYEHQEKAIEWMERREKRTYARLNLNKHAFYQGVCREHPRFILLSTRFLNSLFLIDQMTGHVSCTLDVTKYTPVRGGLLCDEPGLGKTISIISTILKTANILPKNDRFSETEIYNLCLKSAKTGWEELDKIYRRSAMTKILSILRKHPENDWFHYPVNTKLLPDYDTIISRPMDMFTISRNISDGLYDKALDQFEDDLNLCYENAIKYNAIGTEVYSAAKYMKGIMKNELRKAKNRIGRGSREFKLCKDVINERQRISSLLTSAGTLIIVPTPLVNHWYEQFIKAVDFGYIDGDLERCIYFDDGKRMELLDAEMLSRYLVVIIPNTRIRKEHSRSFSDPYKKKYSSPLHQIYWLRLIIDEGHTLGSSTITTMSAFLTEIAAERCWIMSGTPTKDTDVATSLRSLFYLMRFMKHRTFGLSKRGEISGIHTWKETVAMPFMSKKIFGYLRLKYLLQTLMARTLKANVKIPPPKHRVSKLTMSEFERKYYNLRCTFIMTNVALTVKPDGRIQEESLLHRSQRKEALTQMRNLRLMCSGGGKLVCSITDINRQLTRKMLSASPCPNLACKIRTAWRKSPEGFHARQNLCSSICWDHGTSGFGASEDTITRVDRFIGRTITGKTTLCGQCNIPLELQIVLPCGCFFCFECIRDNYLRCRVCQATHTFDEIQLLQPGFSVDWQESLIEAVADSRSRALSRRRTIATPEEVSQASWTSMTWNQEGGEMKQIWQGGVKSKYIHDRIKEIKKTSRPKIIVFSQFRQALNLVGHDLILRFGQNAVAEFYGQYRDEELFKFKFDLSRYWICNRCGYSNQISDKNCRQNEAKLRYEREENNEQFVHDWVAWHNIDDYSLGRRYTLGERVVYKSKIATIVDLRKCSSPRSRFKKKKGLMSNCVIQSETVECFILLLSSDGSHGLDLSFVSHIFLLDKIWNTSLENQVISRAYRMGSKKSVEIETLVMRDTIEDKMLSLDNAKASENEENQLIAQDESNDTPGTLVEMRKLHYLLRRIQLVRDSSGKENPDGNSTRIHKRERSDRGKSGQLKRVRFVE